MKMDKLVVSVVIPTHNRATLLARAIRSVQQQTYQRLEIIVVDDASEDNTREVVEGFDDPRIRYICHDSNRGGSAARNTGICAATGRYIAFLDDDDKWEVEKTAEQLKALVDFDAVLCTSNRNLVGIERYASNRTVELDELRRGCFTAGGTGILMAHARVLKEIMFDETLPRYQDWDIFIRIGQKYKIGYINKALVKYYEGAHNRITNSILNMPVAELEKQLVMLDKHRKFFGSHFYRRHLARALLYGIKHRSNRTGHLIYSIRRCGLLAVTHALTRRLSQIITRRAKGLRV
jgi:glycosyltransferase involved in cell wall biosynthesis